MKRLIDYHKVNYHKILLCVIIALAALSRIYFAYNLPLSGDEAVSLLQATGHALDYKDLTLNKNIPIHEVKKYIDFSKDYGVKSTISSLKYAGMHPPLYYLILYYVIEFLGNSLIVLRSLSILFSLLSILIIYCLGKTAYNEFTGLSGALFMAISPYCLQYSVMVRPYPLIMFLALFSTLQVYVMVKNKSLNYRNIYYYLYILTCLAGLYTLYHFLFIILFQLIFVVFSLPKDRRTTINNLSMFIIIAVLYLPWIPSLKEQLKVVDSSHYYFHGHYNLLSSLLTSIQRNFLFFPFERIFLPSNVSAIKFILSTIIVLLLIIGCIKSFRFITGKYFIIALFSYPLFHYAGDWFVKSRTFSIEKFQFFLVPMLLLVLCYGITCVPKGFYLRKVTLLLCALLLVSGSYYVFQANMNFDGPFYVESFGRLIAESGSKNDNGKNDNGKRLIIVNTPQRRYLLSLVHTIKDPADIAIILGDKARPEVENLDNIKRYNHILLANLFVSYQKPPRFSSEDLNLVADFLNKGGFNQIKVLFNRPDSMLVSFGRNDA